MDQSETKYIKPAKYLERIGEPKLVRWLQENYPLEIVKLVSVPKGEIGDNYIAITSNEDKYFLKIHLRSKLHIDNPQGLENTLSLTSQLHELGIKDVPYPVKTKAGSVEANFGEYTIMITNFVEGENPEITAEVATKFAKLVAKIHQVSTENINLPVEPFDTAYANKLREQLETLEKVAQLNEQKEKLKNLLLPHKTLFLGQLKKLDGFCERAKQKGKSLVVTHGDLIPDNLLLDKDGNIFIVDWDTARLSPPERDVWFFMNTHGENFLRSYNESNPHVKLDIDFISFYMYKRYIEDMVYWADQILLDEVDAKQAEANLEGIKVCCLEAFQDIEQRVKNIDKILSI